jgi:glycolate oxidase iron-sulfur subunit
MQELPSLRKTVIGSFPMPKAPDPAAHIVALADQCVKCGLCLPHCPTYMASREEGESPRGRIALAQALASGAMPASDRALLHLDRCLACRACERVCPPGVRYGELLVRTRDLLARRRGLSATLRRLRWLLRSPRRLALALTGLRFLRRSGLARVTEGMGLTPPADAMPTPPPTLRLQPTGRGASGEVVLFLGCVARRYDTAVHAAALRLLEACGYRVRIPSAQGCCGAVLAHGGDTGGAARMGQALGAILAGDAPVLVSASGCFDGVRQAVGARAQEIHAFLAADPAFAALRWRPLPSRLALHLPCTLHNVSRSADAVFDLLSRIPGLDIARLPQQGRCCGAAGIQFLEQPDQARALRDTVFSDLHSAAAEALCTANIGCRMWLQAGLSGSPAPLPVYHPLELLARQIETA